MIIQTLLQSVGAKGELPIRHPMLSGLVDFSGKQLKGMLSGVSPTIYSLHPESVIAWWDVGTVSVQP